MMDERKWVNSKRLAFKIGTTSIFIAFVLLGIAPWLTGFSLGVKLGCFAIWMVIFSIAINLPYGDRDSQHNRKR